MIEKSPKDSLFPPTAPRWAEARVQELAGANRRDIAVLFTFEFDGLYKNGGIGTYYRQLARALQGAGWFIILVNLGRRNGAEDPSGLNIDFLAHVEDFAEDIRWMDWVPVDPENAESNHWLTMSHRCLGYLLALLDLFPGQRLYAEFHEMCGIGYAAAKASESGLLGPDCVVGMTMHSGHEWIYEANKAVAAQGNEYFLKVSTHEEHSFAAADLPMFPSDSLHDIVKSFGWRLEKAKKLPYLVPKV
jgi:hypothetical protein